MKKEEKKTPSDNDGDEGVTVSEDFQKRAHELVHKASKHEVKHLRDKAYDREDELRKEEDKSSKVKGPKEFSVAGMPD